MDGWLGERMSDGCLDGRLFRRLDLWLNGLMDRLLIGWIDILLVGG